MIGTVFACRGGGRATRLLIAHCDHPGCTASVVCASRAEYEAAAAAGWCRDGDLVGCPVHAGQIELFPAGGDE